MKLNVSMLVVAAMMVGSVGAMGCKSEEKITDTGNDIPVTESTTATPEDNPEAAPVSADGKEATPAFEQDWHNYHYWAYHAPPAARYEVVPVARPGYFWRGGYYGWGGRDYTWYPGSYYAERPGYRYYNPSWYRFGNRWGYRHGYWRR
jgi:hypothetical protein